MAKAYPPSQDRADTPREIRWAAAAGMPHRYIQGRVGEIWAFTIDLGGRGPTLHPKLPGPDGARDFEGPFITPQAARDRADDLLAEFLQQLGQEPR